MKTLCTMFKLSTISLHRGTTFPSVTLGKAYLCYPYLKKKDSYLKMSTSLIKIRTRWNPLYLKEIPLQLEWNRIRSLVIFPHTTYAYFYLWDNHFQNVKRFSRCIWALEIHVYGFDLLVPKARIFCKAGFDLAVSPFHKNEVWNCTLELYCFANV